MATHPGRQGGMRDLWLDREAAEMDSQQYFDELALDDELIRLWEEAQAKETKLQGEIDTLVVQGSEVLF
jgi:hypothetical protein